MIQLKKDIKWMEHALKYAFYAKKKGEIPIGSVLVLENHIIGKGWNCSISNHDPTAHAEIIALRSGGKYLKNYRLNKTTLYVTLEPCIMCYGAIIHSRIKRLVFGANNKKISRKNLFENAFISFQKKNQLIIKKNIMNIECSNILNSFFHKKRNKNILL